MRRLVTFVRLNVSAAYRTREPGQEPRWCSSVIWPAGFAVCAIATVISGRARRRRNLMALSLAGTTLALIVKDRRKVRKQISRQRVEVVIHSTPTLTAADGVYRNPRWAAVEPSAVRSTSNDDAIDSTSSDGSFDDLVESLEPSSKCIDEWDVWLMPSARYHVRELGPLVPWLERLGVKSGIVLVDKGNPGLQTECRRFGTSFTSFDSAEATHLPKAVVVLNDWGGAREMLQDLRRRGVSIISKVEGAQDFRNLDTIRWKLPYSYSDLVLTQGPYDSLNVPNENIAEVGSIRIESLTSMSESGLMESVVRPAVVNYNFSYGTLEWAGFAWMREVAQVMNEGGVTTHVSVHPAATLESGVAVPSVWPLELDLETSATLVSRCSTAIFDMLALGKPVVYYNPHRERAWADVDWQQAVHVARTPAELKTALTSAIESSNSALESKMRQQFLQQHFISRVEGSSAVERTAAAILSVVA